jgi:hypothetical protein
MTSIQRLLMSVSTVVAVVPLFLTWFPWSVTASATYVCLSLAIFPAPTTMLSLRLAPERRWFRGIAYACWVLGLVAVAVALLISNSEAWAPVIWVTFSEVWLGLSFSLILIAAGIRFAVRSQAPIQAPQPSVAELNRSAEES